MKLGQTIISIRKERKMTQEEFARIFHVTRQTVSNWENEKSYPDLETLVRISEEFQVSLDAMLKEDVQMVKKINREIQFSQKFKRGLKTAAGCVGILLLLGAGIYGVMWQQAKTSLEKAFREGIEKNQFQFDEKEGYYKKAASEEARYILPNQKMPGYFDFSLHLHNTVLDYYGTAEGKNIQIRWSEMGKEEDIVSSVSYLDEEGNLEKTLSEKEEEILCESSGTIREVLKEGETIFAEVYKR